MERSKKVEEKGKIRFRKIGGGSLRLPNMRYIRSGDVFEAYPEEIPAAFRDVIIPLDPMPSVEEKEAEIAEVAKTSSDYTLRPRETVGWFDVVDKEGKVVNEKALREEAAKELIKTLS